MEEILFMAIALFPPKRNKKKKLTREGDNEWKAFIVDDKRNTNYSQ